MRLPIECTFRIAHYLDIKVAIILPGDDGSLNIANERVARHRWRHVAAEGVPHVYRHVVLDGAGGDGAGPRIRLLVVRHYRDRDGDRNCAVPQLPADEGDDADAAERSVHDRYRRGQEGPVPGVRQDVSQTDHRMIVKVIVQASNGERALYAF